MILLPSDPEYYSMYNVLFNQNITCMATELPISDLESSIDYCAITDLPLGTSIFINPDWYSFHTILNFDGKEIKVYKKKSL